MSGVGTTNPFALLGDPSDSKPSTKKVEKGGRGSGKASDKGSKGGRGTRGPKRQFDRQSGTGRGKEVHKKGHGKGGWGKFGEEYGTPADDGTRPPRGRGRRGRRGGRKGRGRKGRGGRGANKDATPAADGETPADGEAKETKEGEEAGDKDFEDVEFEGGDEEEEIEDPDNFTLEEYMQGLKVVGGTKKARSVDASDGFKAGKVVPGKKSAAEETEEKFQGSKKKKKKGKKKLNLGIFNETVKPARGSGRSKREGGRGGRRGRGGRGGRGAGGRAGGRGRGRSNRGGRGRGGRRGMPRPAGKPDEFPILA